MLIGVLLLSGCQVNSSQETNNASGKITVITTLYPEYDFAKQIGGDKVNVILLLPPGIEAHSFEPTARDVERISKADLFIYSGAGIEPWVGNILGAVKNSKVTVLQASDYAVLISSSNVSRQSDSESSGDYNPHFWLDLENDQKIVDAIASALAEKDAANADYYSLNAESLKHDLSDLDVKYRIELANCKKRVFITGGHEAFAYLAQRYNLTNVAAFGISPNSEPTPGKIRQIDDLSKRYGIKYIYFEEIVEPRIAEAIAKDVGASTLVLDPLENLPKSEFETGATFVSLMNRNLDNLKLGLECG